MGSQAKGFSGLLNNDQRRALSTRLAALDRQLSETEILLVRGMPDGAMFRIENDLSSERAQAILALFAEARACIERLRDRFELNVQKEDLRQRLAGHFGILWTILENSRAARLKGFGEVSDELVHALDSEIEALIEIVDRIRSLASSA